MDKQDLIRTAGMVVDILEAMGFDESHIGEIANAIQGHLVVRRHYDTDAVLRTFPLETNFN